MVFVYWFSVSVSPKKKAFAKFVVLCCFWFLLFRCAASGGTISRYFWGKDSKFFIAGDNDWKFPCYFRVFLLYLVIILSFAFYVRSWQEETKTATFQCLKCNIGFAPRSFINNFICSSQ